MPVSQFDSTLTVSGSEFQQGPGRTINVGGPLKIGAPDDYVHPISVQFLVVQVLRGDHPDAIKPTGETDRAAVKSKRVRGIGEEVLVNGEPDPANPRWRGTVELGEDIEVGQEDEIKKETRGVAVAVLERKEQFAFDTITWCDRVELLENTQGS